MVQQVKKQASKPVEATKSEKKMPPGKQQFGIIIRKEIHKKAKHLATDMDLAISDVYANGVLMVEDSIRNGGGNKQNELLARELIEGVPVEELGYLKGMAAFLRSRPDPRELEMLRVMLGKYLAPGSISDVVSRKYQQQA